MAWSPRRLALVCVTRLWRGWVAHGRDDREKRPLTLPALTPVIPPLPQARGLQFPVADEAEGGVDVILAAAVAAHHPGIPHPV